MVAGRTCLLADRWFCAGLSESRLTFRQTEGKAAPSVEKYGSGQRLWTVFTETRAAAAAARSVGFTVHRPSRHLVDTRLALALAPAWLPGPDFLQRIVPRPPAGVFRSWPVFRGERAGSVRWCRPQLWEPFLFRRRQPLAALFITRDLGPSVQSAGSSAHLTQMCQSLSPEKSEPRDLEGRGGKLTLVNALFLGGWSVYSVRILFWAAKEAGCGYLLE